MTCILSGLLSVVVLSAPPQPMGLMLGIPPAPEDPIILRVAPEKCAFYVNWMGTAAPDPKSRSQTERLLAEPEVQQLLDAVAQGLNDRAVSAAAKDGPFCSPACVTFVPATTDAAPPRTTAPPTPKAEQDLAKAAEMARQTALRRRKLMCELSKILLTRPTAIFMSECKSGAAPADWRGGMVVGLGKDAARLHDAIDAEIRLQVAESKGRQNIYQAKWDQVEIAGSLWHRYSQKGAAELIVGFHGDYLIAGLGRQSVEGILARMHQDPPEWLTAALRQVPVPRRTGIIYVDMKAVREAFCVQNGPNTIKAAFDIFGLDNATTLISTTGLEDSGMINRVVLSRDGRPHGLLGLISDLPLRAADLEQIPQDASLAMAVRVDLLAVPEVLARAVKHFEVAENALGSLQRDHAGVLASVGDTWRVYNSPGEGGLALTGLTFVAPLRDRPALLKTVESFQAAARGHDARTGPANGMDAVQTFQFEKYKIFYTDCAVFCPAWCATDREVVFSLNVHNLKAFLTRRNGPSLAAVPEVAEAMQGGSRPALLGYCDTPRLFDLGYPLVSMLASTSGRSILGTFGVPEIQPSKWPSAPAIRRHLRPDVTAIERTPQGWQITCRYCFPSGGVNGPVAFLWAFSGNALGDPLSMLGFLQPPIAAGDDNNLVNLATIGFALRDYVKAKGTFPPAYTSDAVGKPLLSWRVALLLYLGQDALYKQFRQEEPWDSPHNQKLLAQMPPCFRDSKWQSTAPGETAYMAVRGDKTLFPGSKGIRPNEVSNGLDHTVAVVVAAKRAAWTSPEDWQYNENDPLAGLDVHPQFGADVLLADGEIRKAWDLRIGYKRLGGVVPLSSVPATYRPAPAVPLGGTWASPTAVPPGAGQPERHRPAHPDPYGPPQLGPSVQPAPNGPCVLPPK